MTTPRRNLTQAEQEQALAAIDKSQLMAGHAATEADLNRAQRILAGELTVEEAFNELDRIYASRKEASP